MYETFETLSTQAGDLEMVVFYNPTNDSVVARAQAFCQDERLSDRNIKTHLIESGSTAADNAELMVEHAPADSGVLVAVAGGDGTTSNILTAALRPVIPLPYGGTNDIAKDAIGGRHFKDPLALLLGKGRFQEVRPLEIATSDDSSADLPMPLRKAFGYFAFGISAIKAERLSDLGMRRRHDGRDALARAWMDLKVIASDIPKTPALLIQDQVGERRVIEVLFANGHCMARVVRFGGVHLESDQTGRLEVGKPRKTSLAVAVGKAALGRFEHFGPDVEHRVRVRTQDDHSFRCQGDGEVEKLASGTTLHVRRAISGPKLLMAA